MTKFDIVVKDEFVNSGEALITKYYILYIILVLYNFSSAGKVINTFWKGICLVGIVSVTLVFHQAKWMGKVIIIFKYIRAQSSIPSDISRRKINSRCLYLSYYILH